MAIEHDPDTVLQHALALAELGTPTFPVVLYRKPDGAWGKRPAIPKDDPSGYGHGHDSASADPDVVRAMFRLVPDAQLIGVPTGPAAGFDALDVDPKNGGITWWAEHRGRLGDTRVNYTISGGLHYLYRHHPGMRNSASAIAKGVDVRGEGGWIVWWPAYGQHVDGDAIAEWPEWLLPLAMPAPVPL